ncbi:hypothetical protein F511_17748 [Dorcoceras hygrometricum]|uniref:Uncharacterized protein n=1 Tax=Dorcoceras hygrometricum TaxID=472368 RepID=A0A2Z7AZI7_9LAMI|nr:hypothetical protein F511_17748 [Dorcoceras hygrometricum]
MESADELAMETSRVDSDVRNQAMAFKKKKKRRWSWNEEVQQEATMKRDAKEKRRRKRRKFSRELLYISRCYLKRAIAKRCRLHKLIRQRFALALKIQQEDFALIISADEAPVDSVATQRYPDARRFRRSIG